MRCFLPQPWLSPNFEPVKWLLIMLSTVHKARVGPSVNGSILRVDIFTHNGVSHLCHCCPGISIVLGRGSTS